MRNQLRMNSCSENHWVPPATSDASVFLPKYVKAASELLRSCYDIIRIDQTSSCARLLRENEKRGQALCRLAMHSRNRMGVAFLAAYPQPPTVKSQRIMVLHLRSSARLSIMCDSSEIGSEVTLRRTQRVSRATSAARVMMCAVSSSG